MAKRVFYGTCSSGAAVENKLVTLTDTEVSVEENFQFKDGDLLTVSFLYMNTAKSPTLVIRNGDTNINTSTTIDSGHFIKTLGVKTDCEGLWDDGETITFCYVKDYSAQPTEVYYWTAVDSGKATNNIYGITRLEYVDDTEFQNWLKVIDDDEDYNTALAPAMLKKLFLGLINDPSQQEYDEQGQPQPSLLPNFNLTWKTELNGRKVPSGEGSDQEDILGYLSLYKDEDDSGNYPSTIVSFPLETFLRDLIPSGEMPDSTSDLINDGPDPTNDNNNTEWGSYYITNVIAGPLYFPNTIEGDLIENEEFIIPNDENGRTSIPRNLYIGGNVEINGSVKANSGIIDNTLSAGNTTVRQLTSNGIINVTGHNITNGGKIYGSELFEDNTSLKNKYSKILQITDKSMKKIKIPKGEDCGHRYCQIRRVDDSNWKPIGIVGYNIDEYETAYKPSYCHMWERKIIEKDYDGIKYWCVMFSIRNYGTTGFFNAQFKILEVHK